MKYCSDCGSYVRHWEDKETGVIHYQCIGCGKKWEEGLENG